MTRIWCIQIGNASTDEVTVYADQPGFPPLSEAIARIQSADETVWHNGLGFDWWALEKFYPGAVDRSRILDTLVMARLSQPEERDHSLRAHGSRLGILKGIYQGDFQTFNDDLVTYARQDIEVGRALYNSVKHVRTWGVSCALEHEVAFALILQERNGFCFNEPAAITLEGELRGEQAALETELKAAFPPRWVPLRVNGKPVVQIPKVRNSKLGTSVGAPYTKVVLEVFNADSRQQVASRLQKLGWKPRSFTPDGHPIVDEKTLATLRAPEAAVLRRHFRLSKQLGQLSDGKGGWLKMIKNGRIHGRVNPNGALTGRMTHSKPNVAQADKNERMRALWIPRPGWALVGCDAEGIEARMLAHYLSRWDKGALADMLLNGDKAKGTDVHSANATAVRKAGFVVNRDGAKVLLYALMYGAGDVKLGSIVIENLRDQKLPTSRLPPRETGALVRRALSSSMTGIAKLTEATAARVRAKQPLIGLDGRKLYARGANSSLNTLLQAAGAVAMKVALKLFMDIHEPTHGTTWALCANIHDEVEMECEPEIADALGTSFADCIAQAGVELNVKCPLAGAYSVGSNWSECH
jgi:DNA polymerase-1